jgi:hypothetical protein
LISSGKKASMVRSMVSDDMVVCGNKGDWDVGMGKVGVL